MHILIIDDHPLFRAGIATALTGLSDKVELSECDSCEQALQVLRSPYDVSLILLDLKLSGVDGMTGMVFLREAAPSTPIVVLSANQDGVKVRQAIDRGAKGYIEKSAGTEVILGAIRLVLAGGVYLPPAVLKKHTAIASDSVAGSEEEELTPRQTEVLVLLAQGLSNKQIADRLDMAENTARVHVASILRVLNVKNRTEAGYQAARLGLIAY